MPARRQPRLNNHMLVGCMCAVIGCCNPVSASRQFSERRIEDAGEKKSAGDSLEMFLVCPRRIQLKHFPWEGSFGAVTCLATSTCSAGAAGAWYSGMLSFGQVSGTGSRGRVAPGLAKARGAQTPLGLSGLTPEVRGLGPRNESNGVTVTFTSLRCEALVRASARLGRSSAIA